MVEVIKFETKMMPTGFDEDDNPVGEAEVLLCPNYPECPVYIHEDTKKHREAIKRHIKKKHGKIKD